MKKRILSVVTCLVLGAVMSMAENVLVIHLSSGSDLRFVLLAEEPTISFVGENVVINTASTELVYDMDLVKSFSYEDAQTPTGVEGVKGNDGMKLDGDRLVLSGLPVGSHVQVFTAAGQLSMSATVGSDGTATLSLSQLARGVYVVKAHQISTKITKK